MTTSCVQEWVIAFELPAVVMNSVAFLVVGADDPEGAIIFASPLTEELFRYDSLEMKGMKIEDLIPVGAKRDEHPTHRSRFAIEGATRTMNAGVYVEGLRKNGTVFKVQISLVPRVIAGKRCVVAFLADVTAAYEHASKTHTALASVVPGS